MPLVAFLERAKLSKHQTSLEEEGYADATDLAEAADEDLAKCGLKKPEVKRLRRTLVELGGDGSSPAGTSAPEVRAPEVHAPEVRAPEMSAAERIKNEQDTARFAELQV